MSSPFIDIKLFIEQLEDEGKEGNLLIFIFRFNVRAFFEEKLINQMTIFPSNMKSYSKEKCMAKDQSCVQLSKKIMVILDNFEHRMKLISILHDFAITK